MEEGRGEQFVEWGDRGRWNRVQHGVGGDRGSWKGGNSWQLVGKCHWCEIDNCPRSVNEETGPVPPSCCVSWRASMPPASPIFLSHSLSHPTPFFLYSPYLFQIIHSFSPPSFLYFHYLIFFSTSSYSYTPSHPFFTSGFVPISTLSLLPLCPSQLCTLCLPCLSLPSFLYTPIIFHPLQFIYFVFIIFYFLLSNLYFLVFLFLSLTFI